MAKYKLEDIAKRCSDALEKKEQWRSIYEDCYEFAMPSRNIYDGGYENRVGGQNKMVRVFDSTAIHSTHRFANRLQSGLFPPYSRWCRLEAGPEIPPERRPEAQAALDIYTEKMFSVLRQTNFDLAMGEFLLDLCAGTAAMIIQPGDAITPIKYQTVPPFLLGIEEGANGVIDNTQRSAIQNEFSALASEIERIAVTTKFNGLNLIQGGNDLTFQIGFDGGSTSQLTYGAVDVRLAGMGLASTGVSAPSFSVLATAGDEVQSQVAARSALDAIQLAITSVNQQRGKLGALESRLEVTINNLQVARENFKAAESRIRDVDVATEAAELTRLNILQQAGAAVLAQANQVPQLALQLLGR
jgi:hypothetical protein